MASGSGRGKVFLEEGVTKIPLHEALFPPPPKRNWVAWNPNRFPEKSIETLEAEALAGRRLYQRVFKKGPK
jgi:hypothetical protein